MGPPHCICSRIPLRGYAPTHAPATRAPSALKRSHTQISFAEFRERIKTLPGSSRIHVTRDDFEMISKLACILAILCPYVPLHLLRAAVSMPGGGGGGGMGGGAKAALKARGS